MRPGSQITGSPARRSTTEPDEAWDPWNSSGAPHFRDTDFRNTGKAQPTYYGSEPVENVDSHAPRTGAHRIPTPPTALKGRAAVFAVAAGAVVAAGQAATSNSVRAPRPRR